MPEGQQTPRHAILTGLKLTAGAVALMVALSTSVASQRVVREATSGVTSGRVVVEPPSVNARAAGVTSCATDVSA
jgi:hypothetical protein